MKNTFKCFENTEISKNETPDFGDRRRYGGAGIWFIFFEKYSNKTLDPGDEIILQICYVRKSVSENIEN